MNTYLMATETTTEQTPEQAETQTPEYSAEELKLTEKAQNLLNQRGRKYTIGADRTRAYMEIISNTEDFLAGVSKAQMRRIATGEDRVPRVLTDKYKDVYSSLKPHWHWLKGIIAVAVAAGYEPPKGPEVETEES